MNDAPVPASDGHPILIFCSYSHHDHPFRIELETQLSPLVRQKLITFWSDRRIAPGAAWEQAIDDRLETAEIVLLLISAYFVQSDYCYTRELQRALERDRQRTVRVVPVFVRPCAWEGLDFAHLQGLPEGGRPITGYRDREEAWTAVVRGIRRIALELQSDKRSTQPQRVSIDHSSEAKYDSRAYLRSLVTWHRNAFENIRETSLNTILDGKVTSVREALADWLGTSHGRFAIMSGDPGSGKTYAFRTLAARLAEHYLSAASTAMLPVFVPAKRLSPGDPLDALRTAVPEALGVVDEIMRKGTGVILIDGVDEAPPTMSDEMARFTSELARATPNGVKVGLSCRPPLRDPLIAAVTAVTAAPVALEIQAMSDDQIRHLLDDPGHGALAIAPSLRQPFALSLMAVLSERRSDHRGTRLLDLYTRALDILIERERERSTELQQMPSEAVWTLLTDAAEKMFGMGSVPLKHVQSDRIKGPERAAWLNALISAGVIALDTRERVTFAHETVFDYFSARVLERELSLWNAKRLAQSNLIYSYNVNRFLVPMLRHRQRSEFGASAHDIRGELFPSPSASVGAKASGLVSCSQFEIFMRRTRWRSTVGFGYWGVFSAADGTNPTSGGVDFDGQTATRRRGRPDDPVSGVSWYDAQQFAWWIGGRLPSWRDCEPVSNMFQWTSTWHDESKALMRLVGLAADQSPAANPDVRSSDLGFRVMLDPFDGPTG